MANRESQHTTSLWSPGHCLVVLLLIWFIADVMDPFTPGVFSLENDGFFIDGVVQVKSTAFAPLTPLLPTVSSINRLARDAENTATTKMDAVRRLLRSRSRPAPWKYLKHDDSASFAPSASPDSLPSQS